VIENFQLKPEDLKLKKTSDYFEYFFSLEDIADRFKQFLQPEEPEKAALVVEGLPQDAIAEAPKLPSIDLDSIKTISITDKLSEDTITIAICDINLPALDCGSGDKGPSPVMTSEPVHSSDHTSQTGQPVAALDSLDPGKTELHSA